MSQRQHTPAVLHAAFSAMPERERAPPMLLSRAPPRDAAADAPRRRQRCAMRTFAAPRWHAARRAPLMLPPVSAHTAPRWRACAQTYAMPYAMRAIFTRSPPANVDASAVIIADIS
jgi:hypothetical protein